MPRDTSDIGSSGLEQGGGNLGNDYSRRVTTDRNEQNTTTNVGSSGTSADENGPDRSERILDKEEDDEDEDSLGKKAQAQTDKLKNAADQDSERSDNQNPSERILDKDDGDEGGSLPDRETLKMRGDE